MIRRSFPGSQVDMIDELITKNVPMQHIRDFTGAWKHTADKARRQRQLFANSVEELGADLLDDRRRRLVFQAFRLGCSANPMRHGLAALVMRRAPLLAAGERRALPSCAGSERRLRA
jgi:hypothetical protein